MAFGFRTEAFRIVLLCSLWYTISSSNNVIGKKILIDFPFPVTLAMVQVASTALYLSPTLHVWKIPRMRSIPKSSLVKLILPLSFGKAFSSITSHISIWKVPVSYAHTVKATMPVFTVVLSRIVLGESQTKEVYCSLIPVVGGVMIATATEVSFNIIGLLSALMATLTFAVQNIFTKKAMRDLQLNHLRLLLLMTIMASLMLLPFWALYDLRKIIILVQTGKQEILWLLVILIINGFLNFAQNMVAFTVLSIVTPLSYSVAASMKRILVITVSVVLLRNPVGVLNVIGMFVAIFGVFLYNKVCILVPSAFTWLIIIVNCFCSSRAITGNKTK
ncbi:PREDICTED: solute carrier family 35 member E1-like isoform X2 [Acropora digitifera]|uniref:solute carrier family 35 member E1-like isoform X2 n=1 Tax=Acropora digitifera TaxID=70779 RepID=UPI00077A9212|nr:PREDICTED: solute carrier family 35 member E1-like isoform X2 [Acropora digitifera]